MVCRLQGSGVQSKQGLHGPALFATHPLVQCLPANPPSPCSRGCPSLLTPRHKKGIVHRDLKSPNLLVEATWKVKVAGEQLLVVWVLNRP